MGAAEVEAFLTHWAVAERVSASTQNQAKSAILFLYKEVLGNLFYGTGMRIMECVRVRVKDVDFARGRSWSGRARARGNA